MFDPDKVTTEFRDCYGRPPTVIAWAPGRVNIIGEHTDYNEGFVLPFAIEQGLFVAGRPARGHYISAHSLELELTVTFPLNVDRPAEDSAWQNYLRGVVCGLGRRGVDVRGADLLIGGDLPMGGGLSSSAALCVAAALALLKLAGGELPLLEIAKLCRQAEHEFAGTPCGIMDPYVSLFGRAGHALLLDCRRNEHELVPLDLTAARFVVIDSGVTHELSTGAYRERVLQCRQAAAALSEHEPQVAALRDVTAEMLERYWAKLNPQHARRARHVVSENARVLEAAAALRRGNPESLGRWLDASHASLRDDFEVSCAEIDALIAALGGIDGVLGARMVGGGGGGMVLALAKLEALGTLETTLSRHVAVCAQRSQRIRPVGPCDGALCLTY